jgi:hypothetical protein
LLLSHFYREVDPLKAVAAAGKQFDGKVFAAEDGLSLICESGAGAKLHKSLKANRLLGLDLTALILIACVTG